jgi:CRISPR/Cas system-associated protein Cas10 (large subunit of type III CRISPR-Cas system)
MNTEDTMINAIVVTKEAAKDIDLSGIFRMTPEEIGAAMREFERNPLNYCQDCGAHDKYGSFRHNMRNGRAIALCHVCLP